jgi:nifR3 family TIM-barrel protein
MMSDQKLSNMPAMQAVPVALAPLSGISDIAFRRIARRWGADSVVTEMVAAHEYVRGSEEARLRAEGSGLTPHIVQLVGREPHSMAEGARLAEGSGAHVIDINMGCPAKKVTGGLCGSALMREAELAIAIVAAVVAAVRVPVTLKMRLGWDAANMNAPELARRAAAAGVKAVTVHGRTRQQFYSGTADWGAIGSVVRAVDIPVTANGDVVCVESARGCLAQSGAAGLMVGRAAVGQPWLVGKIAAALRNAPWMPPTPNERASLAMEHYEALLALYGQRMGTRHARKHLAAYADRAREDGFRIPDAERLQLVTTEEPAQALRLLSRLYAERRKEAA